MENTLTKLSESELRGVLEALQKEYDGLIAVAKEHSRDEQVEAKISELQKRITRTINALESKRMDSLEMKFITLRIFCDRQNGFHVASQHCP